MNKADGKIHDARFISLVLSVHNAAWVALGKVANPVTGKVEKDLEAAQGSIDLLETLKVKTKGNVSKEEDNIISNCLNALHLNYVEETKGDQAAPAGTKERETKDGDREEQAATDTKERETKGGGTEEQTVKKDSKEGEGENRG
jgi:hypothetical protein